MDGVVRCFFINGDAHLALSGGSATSFKAIAKPMREGETRLHRAAAMRVNLRARIVRRGLLSRLVRRSLGGRLFDSNYGGAKEERTQ